jgi:lipopolysaccharide/colanic/teichoic acid biosynthesis glycosyltransferase
VPLLERTAALVLALALSPILVLASAAIIWTDGWPPLFRQQRAGVRGEPFNVAKLRTMRRDLPPPEELRQVRAGDPNVLPRVGDFLRRSRLDEVPQLVNVVRGQMRLIGPRPALTSDLANYSWLERRRLEVPPGMTGWAQVNGNTSLDWQDRIALDLYYIDHRNAMLDLRILGMTLATIVLGERDHAANLRRAREYANRLARNRPVDGGSA